MRRNEWIEILTAWSCESGGRFGVVSCSHCESMLENKTKVVFTHVRIFLGSDKLITLVFHVIKKKSATDTYGTHDSCAVFHLSTYWFSWEKKTKTKTRTKIRALRWLVVWIVLSLSHESVLLWGKGILKKINEKIMIITIDKKAMDIVTIKM